ncbi:hypothetical protein [Nocardia rhizosphaerae]|uniref:Holin n=1 Tax=Nocardia rhizosphaerae TaxID=1691571 RepID=A0ABV8LDY5_9NOCA
MTTEIRRAWQVATWFDKLFLIMWPAAAILHVTFGDWLVAVFAALIALADFAALQYKADAAEWKAKYEAAVAPATSTNITIRSEDVDSAVRRYREHQRSTFGYDR